MVRTSSPPALEGKRFDISSLVGGTKKSQHGLNLFFAILGTSFLVLWGVAILPGFFEPPRVTNVCSRGVCNQAPAADYYSDLDLYTAVAMILVVAFYLAAFWSRLISDPTEVSVDSRGFTVSFGPKRQKRISWEAPYFFCLLNDLRDAAQAHPKDFANRPNLLAIQTNFWSVSVTEPAFFAILGSARSAGLQVQVIVGGAKSYPEYVGYRIWPQAKLGS
jgi:hypothetical protein